MVSELLKVCELTITGLGNIKIYSYIVAVYMNRFWNYKHIIINSDHGSNYYKGHGNIKCRCIILILFNNGIENIQNKKSDNYEAVYNILKLCNTKKNWILVLLCTLGAYFLVTTDILRVLKCLQITEN